MGRYMVTAKFPHPGNVQWIADKADSEADAIAQFRKEYAGMFAKVAAIDPPPDPPINLEIVAVGLQPPAPAPGPAPETGMPQTALDAIAKIASPAEPSAVAAPEPPPAGPPESIVPRDVGVLNTKGVSANDIIDLRKAGLDSVEAVKAEGKKHGGLTHLPGIGQVGNDTIARAIKALG